MALIPTRGTRARRPAVLAVWLLAVVLPLGSGSGHALERVTLQLKWTHCFQFAGYYAAQEQGYYREAGLDVHFDEGRPGVDVVGRVLSGEAQFGVGTSSLLLARAAGRPVVVLAVVFQHSPLVLIARDASGVQSVHDLVGQRVMIEPEADEVLAYLRRERVPLERLERVPHSFGIQALIEGEVAAMTAYLTNEPELLERLGVPYRVYSPRSAGIDFYGDNLFTSEQELRAHPKRVRAFLAASRRGWQYAMSHREEVIALIRSRYGGTDSAEHYAFEAERIASLMHPELIEIGYMNPGRWQHIAEVYAEVGLLPPNLSLDGFLYQADPRGELTRVQVLLALALALAGLIGGVALYILRINRRLKRGLKDLQEAQQRLQVLSLAIEQSPASVVITGPDAAIEYVNPSFLSETGYTSEEVLGQNPRVIASGLTPRPTFEEMWSHLRRGEPWKGELINRRKSGELYWEEAHIAPVKDPAGQTTHFVAVKLDVTARKAAYEQLAHLAHHDALTDLPNRTLFFERLDQGLALARRHGTRLALMFVDLDRFKAVNDTWGHAAGDRLLQEAARRMRGCLRASDSVGRIGGDEFVVLLNEVADEPAAVQVAELIRAALETPFAIEGQSLEVSASIGLALFPDHGDSAIELARAADSAMYQGKQGGTNRVQVWEPETGVPEEKPAT